ncbi:hypothetical protein JOD27_005415 [Lentzea nigeriaca]|nr:hypothetical protein [Lentzea nigeriaca]
MPEMHVPGARWAMLTNAGLPAGLLNEVRYQGSTSEFIADLVHRCGEYAADTIDGPPIIRVLHGTAAIAGEELRAELIDLADAITQPGRATPEDFADALALDASDSTGLSPYRAIDRLFVPPKQYDRIRQVLAKQHAVVILGDPHMGKTYSAVRLLWELYRDEGRPPRWINSNRLATALQSPEGNFETQIKQLFPKGSAVYLEDPFGTTVPLDMRDFVDNLKSFFRIVKNSDVRVVITSRSHVFNQAIPNLLADYVVTLSQQLVLDKSYDQEDLFELIERYLREYRVAWRHQATPDIMTAVAAELRAPHNIALFITATRNVKKIKEALTELPSYHDIVEQFALTLRDFPLWQHGFLCTSYFFSSFDVNIDITRRLFEDALAEGDFGRPELVSWDRAVLELADYVEVRDTFSHTFVSLRHPSIEEAFDQRVRADPQLLELVRLLLVRAASSSEQSVAIAALRCFVHYSDRYWLTTWGPRFFSGLLDRPNPYLREVTRLHVISESHHLPAEQRETLHAHAETTWNDRFLMRLLIGAPVSSARRGRLVRRLATTWDDWVRYQLARQIRFLQDRDESASTLLILLDDQSPTVAKAAIASLVSLGFEEEARAKAPAKLRAYLES